MTALLNLILYQPDIPQNTGSIGRLCVLNDLHLHLIEPLGFSLEDKYLKRSGLDYWPHLTLTVWPSWEAYTAAHDLSGHFFFSSKAKTLLWGASFSVGDSLVFGPETCGLPPDLIQTAGSRALKIPMLGTGEHVRSLNLATSVGIVTYEAIRQLTSLKPNPIAQS